MEEIDLRELLQTAIDGALEAGRKILEVYESSFEVELKDDDSPLTKADKRSHVAIKDKLSPSGIPLLSEEGRDIPFNERREWEQLWIVDPLDGTKEFIKRNGEFTVNVALVREQEAILGVIYVPVKETLYFAADGIGAFRTDGINANSKSVVGEPDPFEDAQRLPLRENRSTYKVVGSRSHLSPETEQFISSLKDEHGEIELVSMGSSLKICLVAEGAADIYPRFAPTMEWDTAAGAAIARFAGKGLIDYHTKEPMKYNKENLTNNWFVGK